MTKQKRTHQRKSSKIRRRHPGKTLHYTRFVIGRVDTPESVAIDEQLRKIFTRLNQTYSGDFSTPHSYFLSDQLNALDSANWNIDSSHADHTYRFKPDNQ